MQDFYCGFAITWPFILNITVLLAAFEVTVIDLLNVPGRFVLYFTLISPFSPGPTGVLVHSGVVQPQEALTLESTTGAFPLFVNVNTVFPSPPNSIVP